MQDFFIPVNFSDRRQTKKPHIFCEAFCGPDGTRTRDLRRDRAAF